MHLTTPPSFTLVERATRLSEYPVNIVCLSDAKYEYQIEALLRSINHVCQTSVRLVYYTVGFESSITYPNLTKVPWPLDARKTRFEFHKPGILLDALRRFAGHFLYLDSDVLVSSRFSPRLFVHDLEYPLLAPGNWDSPFAYEHRDVTQPFPVFRVGDRVALRSGDTAAVVASAASTRSWSTPLCPEAAVVAMPESEYGFVERLDPTLDAYHVDLDSCGLRLVHQAQLAPMLTMDHHHLMRYFNIPRATMPYVSTCFISFSALCEDLFIEWKAVAEDEYLLRYQARYFPFPDETALNAVLWRRGIAANYGRIFFNTRFADSAIEVERDTSIRNSNIFGDTRQYCADSSKVILYHGVKDVGEQKMLLDHLLQQGHCPHFAKYTTDGVMLSMQQRPEVFAHFRQALTGVPLARILEVGTAEGGLTVGLRELFPEVPITTIDIVERPWYRAMFAAHNISYRIDGAYDGSEVAAWVQQPGISLVLCDGGNKLREFAHFAGIIKPGDIIAAHDYEGHPNHLPWGCVETSDGGIAVACAAHGLEPFQHDLFGRVVWAAKRKV
jgi:hypothetical protein